MPKPVGHVDPVQMMFDKLRQRGMPSKKEKRRGHIVRPHDKEFKEKKNAREPRKPLMTSEMNPSRLPRRPSIPSTEGDLLYDATETPHLASDSSKYHRRIPDLVQDSKLETRIIDSFFVHHRDDSEEEESPTRSAPEPEYWENQTQLAVSFHSEVWLQKCVQGPAKHQDTLRAVKIIPRSKSSTWSHSELEVFAKFSQKRYSRYFAKMLGWFETPTSLCIAMEYFPLGDLQGQMTAALPESDTRTILFQVLEGLDCMHSAGFTHRDIKPGNILIQRKPPDAEWRVKLSDFGISKRVDTSGVVMTSEKGTIPYMAPELFGHEPGSQVHIDFKAADMWALGEMLFRMLTKRAVFLSHGALLRYTVRPELFPSAVVAERGISDHGTTLIQRLMEPQPKDRLTTKGALDHAWLETCKTKRSKLSSPSYPRWVASIRMQ